MSTHYYKKIVSTAWSAFAATLVTDVNASYEDSADLWPAGATIATQGEIDIIEDTTGEIQQTLTTSAVDCPGVNATVWGPLAVGVCLTFQTAGVVAGRHVKGRTYLVPIHIGAWDADGSPSSATLALADLLGQNLIAVGGAALDMTVWSRPKYELPKTTPPEYVRYGSNHQVTSASTKDIAAVLRSRRD
jgi:hypothetical protein